MPTPHAQVLHGDSNRTITHDPTNLQPHGSPGANGIWADSCAEWDLRSGIVDAAGLPGGVSRFRHYDSGFRDRRRHKKTHGHKPVGFSVFSCRDRQRTLAGVIWLRIQRSPTFRRHPRRHRPPRLPPLPPVRGSRRASTAAGPCLHRPAHRPRQPCPSPGTRP